MFPFKHSHLKPAGTMKQVTILCLCLLMDGSLATTTLELLQAEPDTFSTLVSLLKQANLIDALNNGTYTIFAPSNTAFTRLPPDTLSTLQNDTAGLTNLLLYHATGGRVQSASVQNDMIAYMENGQQARVNIYPKNNIVTIQGQTISQFDKVASNGVIHVLVGVMMSPRGDNLQSVARHPSLTTLLGLVIKAGLAQPLQADSLTIFAPTNDAFAKIPQDQLAKIESDSDVLAGILKYHIVLGTFYSSGLYDRENLPTLNIGTNLTVHRCHHGEVVNINSASVIAVDSGSTSGVVHLIDQVLLPPENNPAVGK